MSHELKCLTKMTASQVRRQSSPCDIANLLYQSSIDDQASTPQHEAAAESLS
jgi:hypothetical protein